MIVDFHTHVNSFDDASISKHLEAIRNIDHCVVLGSYDKDSEKVNQDLGGYVKKHDDKLIGFGKINPIEDNVSKKNLKNLIEKNCLSGIVLYCSSLGFHPSHSRAMRVYEFAEEAGFPVFFHNSGHLKSDAKLEFAQPVLLDEIARSFPRLKIMIGSMGRPFIEQTLAMAGKHENVYANLTINPKSVWQLYNIVVSAYEREVMDKLVFGSGYPFKNVTSCVEALLGFNKLLGDSSLPTVPRGEISDIIERDSLALLGIGHKDIGSS